MQDIAVDQNISQQNNLFTQRAPSKILSYITELQNANQKLINDSQQKQQEIQQLTIQLNSALKQLDQFKDTNQLMQKATQEIDKLNQQTQQLETENQNLKQQIKQRSQSTQQLSKAVIELDKNKQLIEQLNIMKEYQVSKTELTHLRKENNELVSLIQDYEDKYKTALSDMKVLQQQNALLELQINIRELNKNSQDFIRQYCITNDDSINSQLDISLIDQYIDKQHQSMIQSQNKQKTENQQLKEIQQKYQNQIDQLTLQNQQLNQENQNLKQQLQSLQSSTTNNNQNVQEVKQHYKKQIRDLKNLYETSIKKYISIIQQLQFLIQSNQQVQYPNIDQIQDLKQLENEINKLQI